MTFVNSWVIFEELVVDRHGLWRYVPFYRVGLFCTWDVLVLAVILLLVFLGIAPLRRALGRMVRNVCNKQKQMSDYSLQQSANYTYVLLGSGPEGR